MTTRIASTVAGVPAHNSYTDLQRAAVERQVFFEVINALNAAGDLHELLVQVHLSLQKVLSAKNCYVALYDRQSEMFHFPFYVDQFVAPPPPHKVGRDCAAYVFRSGWSLLLTPEAFERLAAAGEVERDETASRAWLGVPLSTSSEALGVWSCRITKMRTPTANPI